MKNTVRIVQVLVGLLFIFSGLVKANDPLGLSYKMQEFFELWSAASSQGSVVFKGLQFLHNNSLGLSIAMNCLEIFSGVALLTGWKKNFILWLLLLLILFFTLLTGYAYLSGKFTNCGCFGDCLPITPLTSFGKDLLLTGMILFLLFQRKHIQPIHSVRAQWSLLAVSLLGTLLGQWYVLNYLPVADCLPFKKGNNIAQQMKPPAGSLPDSFAIRFVYEKSGKQFEFAPENLPADFTTYKFIDRKQSLVRKGNADPPIKGFSLTGITGQDSTEAVLKAGLAVLIYTPDFKEQVWMQQLKNLTAAAGERSIPVFVASPNLTEGIEAFAAMGLTGVQFFNSDFTVVRTVARTTPTILFLKEGTVVKKYSKKEIDKAAQELSAPKF